jgi:hypothetical protein
MGSDCELVLDGTQRLAAVLHLFDITAATLEGQGTAPPKDKVQFHPSTRAFRVSSRSRANVPTTVDADPTVCARARGWVDVAPVLTASDADARAIIRNIVANLGAGEVLRERQCEALVDLRAMRRVDLPVITFIGDVAQVIELASGINELTARLTHG